jgi:hypothetical protein
LNSERYRGCKTLIVGEVHSGKTSFTLKIFRDLRKSGAQSIAVLDLAPEKTGRVGGKMPLPDREREGALYLSPLILPPRLLGKNEEGVRKLAGENRQRIDTVLENLRSAEATLLFVNDLSLYFHAGHADRLWREIEPFSTVVMNGYYGRYFGDSALSRRERAEMESLMARCDRVLFLPPLPSPSSSKPIF